MSAMRFVIYGAGRTRRSCGSSWQSVARGTGHIETDYLSGEIVLLGRLRGVPTPANEVMQWLGNELDRRKLPPGSFKIAAVRAKIDAQRDQSPGR